MAYKHSSIDNFFAHVSRFTIIIPIAVIIFATSFKVLDMISPKKSTDTLFPTPTGQAAPKKSPSINIDLKGPYVCNHKTEEASVSAFIKDKNVYIANQKKAKTNYFLLRGDCLYIWEKSSFTGEKVCGLGPYISLAEMFSQMGALGGSFSLTGSLSTLKNVMSGTSPQAADAFQDIDLAKALQTCRKKEVTNTAVFTIPQNILFKNVDLQTATPTQPPTPYR